MASVVAAAAVVASLAPLATYALSLAAFGLVHVLSEVRYVDERFRLRLGQGLVAGVLGLLAIIVGWRTWLACGGSAGTATASIELTLVLLLALTALVAVRHAGMVPALVATAVVVLIAVGAYAAPLTALVLLAVLHNLTPVGFLAERLCGQQRRRALLTCGVVFVIVPVIIGSGFLRQTWQTLGLPGSGTHAEPIPFWGIGEIYDHIGVFVPPALTTVAGAIDLFAAVVYLQVMHYATVIHILPRLNREDSEAFARTTADKPPTAWPTGRVFAIFLGVVAAGSLVAFALSFNDARRIYGIFAAFHAWLEVPILLLALGGGNVLRQRVPA